jgi:hypothetical protein
MDQAVARAPKPGPHRFKPGRQKEGGRRIGSTNKVPRLLKEAIMLAAELEGSNGHGSGKLVGFLRRVAREDLKSFCMLLARVLPLQLHTQADERVEVTYRTIEEVRHELEERGITIDVVSRILHQPPEQIELE